MLTPARGFHMKRTYLLFAVLMLAFAAAQSASATCNRDRLIVTPPPSFPVIASEGRDPARRVNETSQSDDPQSIVRDNRDLINPLGIEYARRGRTQKNYKIAFKLFRKLAMDGYAPGMANLGTLYEWGPGGRRDHLRAYAWIRAGLMFGVPESDYDATLFKLGMIAGRLSAAKMGSAERLAVSITQSISSRSGSSGEISAVTSTTDPIL